MRRFPQTVTVGHILELESPRWLVEFNLSVECRVTPGEPMVRYYPDGSGYPGSGLEVEVLSAECEEFSRVSDDRNEFVPCKGILAKKLGAALVDRIDVEDVYLAAVEAAAEQENDHE